MAEKSTEDRVRDKAYELWEADGRPHGRDEFHWSQARQIIAIEDSRASTLISLTASLRDGAEPALAFENQAASNDLTDQGEGEPGPSWEAAAGAAVPPPLSEEQLVKKPAVKRAATKTETSKTATGKTATGKTTSKQPAGKKSS